MITSLFSLFGVGTSDRFSVAYSASYCIFVGKPWDCTPLNPVDDMLWAPYPNSFFPRARWGSAWFQEIDLASDGDYSLWNMITKNSNIKCLQQNPFWPANEKTNPVICSLPPPKGNTITVIFGTLAAAFLVYTIIASCLQKK